MNVVHSLSGEVSRRLLPGPRLGVCVKVWNQSMIRKVVWDGMVGIAIYVWVDGSFGQLGVAFGG